MHHEVFFFLPNIQFLGFVTDENGYRPDLSEMADISQMPARTNKTRLPSLLGLLLQQFHSENA